MTPKRRTLAHEFFLFFKKRKAYWLLPLVLFVMALAAIFVISATGGGAMAPFIYTLF